MSNDPEFPEIAYQGIEQDIAATARILESHRAKWEDLAHKAWKERDEAINRWLEDERKLGQAAARIEALRLEALELLALFHSIEHGYISDVRRCRADICTQALEVIGADPEEPAPA
jgi:hypothetical protein